MDRIPSRLISALAALPISFLFLPYAVWRSKQDPWYGIFYRPLLIIFFAWLFALFFPVAPAWIISLVFIVWQASSLRAAVDAHRPRPQPQREAWRR